jgi:hypothetical protein
MLILGYLDPGTGSLIMQALLAGAAGVAVLWKTTARRFRGNPVDEPKTGVEDASAVEEPTANPSD